MSKRELTVAEAIRESIDLCLTRDQRVFLIGLGVPDPKGIFGTTYELQKKWGPTRVQDMPVSENGMTGICIGAAIRGMRPILTHQRIDFSLLSMDQIVNNAAKWYYMFGQKRSVPIVIRVIVGRGWGQGSQHSQTFQSIFAHFPGLKIVMPAFAADAKGLLIAAVEDDNPVIYVEHRWIHNIRGEVPKQYYTTEIGKASVIHKGKDITLVSSSYMTIESLKAALNLEKEKISVDVIDLKSLKPFDLKTVVASLKKTGRLLIADMGYQMMGFGSEVISQVNQYAFSTLRQAPEIVATPDIPTPTSWKLAEQYYPTYLDIMERALKMIGAKQARIEKILKKYAPTSGLKSDVPDASFTGPF